MERSSLSGDSTAKKKERIQELDAFRFLAALAVVFYHLTYSKSGQNEDFLLVSEVTRYGYLGVEFFFLISGFVILWSAEGRTLWQFFVSRFTRLYPLFWISMGLVALLVGAPVLKIAANATMIAGYLGHDYIDGVYWTLQVELKFYLLVGLLLLFKQGRRFEQWVFGWFLLAILAEFVPAIRSLIIYPYAPLFIGGAICFVIRSKGLSVSRFMLFLCAMFLSMRHANTLSEGFVGGDVGHVPTLAVAGMYLMLFLVALKRLRIRCGAVLASMTYPLYLLHNEIGRKLYAGFGADGWSDLVVTLIFIFALAYVLSQLDNPVGNWVKSLLQQVRKTFFAKVSYLKTLLAR